MSHDLTLLSDMVKTVDAEATRFDELIDYSPYAVQFRYAASTDGEPLERNAALRLSEELAEHVETMFENLKKEGS